MRASQPGYVDGCVIFLHGSTSRHVLRRGACDSRDWHEQIQLAPVRLNLNRGMPMHCELSSKQGQQELLDLDDFDSLVFRVRGDGNKYLASLRTENWIVGDNASDDVWQAFLFARCVAVIKAVQARQRKGAYKWGMLGVPG